VLILTVVWAKMIFGGPSWSMWEMPPWWLVEACLNEGNDNDSDIDNDIMSRKRRRQKDYVVVVVVVVVVSRRVVKEKKERFIGCDVVIMIIKERDTLTK
jgi:hypothetical protein